MRAVRSLVGGSQFKHLRPSQRSEFWMRFPFLLLVMLCDRGMSRLLGHTAPHGVALMSISATP
ncbi:hypothetical protein CLM74_11080 [Stenotrophomonas sp. MYb57]|nr:hypothetical protein CLM74_11080 [Stenotrophomonas sp. MYb57]